MPRPSQEELLEEVKRLQARLEEAEDTLCALRSGEVDALVMSGPEGEQVYTLRGAERAYRVMVEQMAEGAATVTAEGLILYANEQFARMVGSPLERVIGAQIQEFIAPGDQPEFPRLLADGLLSRAKREVQLKGPGATIPTHLSISRLDLDYGQCACLIATDLTEQKRWVLLQESEARARSRAAELEAVMETVPAAVFIAYDPECRVIIGNRMAHELLRIPAGENLSMSAPEGKRPAHFKVFRGGKELSTEELPVQLAAATGQVLRDYEFDLQFEGGAVKHLLGAAVPLCNEMGHSRGAVAAFHDVTELKQVEEGLRQAQKMESIGLLAGGVAHDFNNLLTGIMCNASLVLEDLHPSSPCQELMEGLMRSADRAAHLTRQLLAYAGKGRFTVSPINLSKLVREMAQLMRASVPTSTEIRFELAEDLVTVEADSGQMQQIVMNLLQNASEAIGGASGKIVIRTCTRSADQALIDQTGLGIAVGTYVCLEVLDTGRGMEPAVRERIFEPFFTTKFQGRGLGLAAVQGIVRAHGGVILAQSQPGKGSQFTVLLPASRAATRVPPPAAVIPEQHLAGQGTILVVDDEPSVRMAAQQTLERCGYTVLLAENGAEALRTLQRAPNQIKLVLLDLTMPVMSGEETLKRIRALRPELPVLLSSGYNETELTRRFADQQPIGFIGKPYSAAVLTAKVKAIGEET